MTPETAEKFLRDLAQQWRRKIYFATALKASGLSMLAAALFHFMTDWPAAIFIGIVFLIAIFFIWIRLSRNQPIDASLMARHLNRTRPELEESCQLLLKPELTVLEEMQHRRVLQEMNNWRAQPRLPRHVLRSAWILFAASATLALGVAIGTAFYSSPVQRPINSVTLAQRPDSLANTTVDLALKIEAVRVEILPPAYTGQAKHALSQFELAVEEGARIAGTSPRINLSKKARSFSATTIRWPCVKPAPGVTWRNVQFRKAAFIFSSCTKRSRKFFALTIIKSK
jgi:hypothetical protein